jgi:hypothetical protein
MDRLETKRQLLLERIRAAASIIESDEDVIYVVCARMRDDESGKVLTGILTNTYFRDGSGKTCPPTLGMMSDLLLEAVLDDPDVGLKQNTEHAVDEYTN